MIYTIYTHTERREDWVSVNLSFFVVICEKVLFLLLSKRSRILKVSFQHTVWCINVVCVRFVVIQQRERREKKTECKSLLLCRHVWKSVIFLMSKQALANVRHREVVRAIYTILTTVKIQRFSERHDSFSTFFEWAERYDRRRSTSHASSSIHRSTSKNSSSWERRCGDCFEGNGSWGWGCCETVSRTFFLFLRTRDLPDDTNTNIRYSLVLGMWMQNHPVLVTVFSRGF